MSRTEQLLHAAQRGQFSVVKRLLLVQGAVDDVNATDEHGSTALLQAIQHGRLDVALFLANRPGVDLNHRDKYNGTALIYAADRNCVALVKHLLSKPTIDVNLRNAKGSTALHCASFRGNSRVVHLLLSHPRIDVALEDFQCMTAMEVAEQQGQMDVLHLMEFCMMQRAKKERQGTIHTRGVPAGGEVSSNSSLSSTSSIYTEGEPLPLRRSTDDVALLQKKLERMQSQLQEAHKECARLMSDNALLRSHLKF